MEVRKEKIWRALYDFDGTIVEFNFPLIGKPRWDIIQTAHAFKSMGYEIVVWSGRSAQSWSSDKQEREARTREMKEFLDSIEFPYDWIDDGSNGKIPADIMIDDTGVPANAQDINQKIREIIMRGKESYQETGNGGAE